MRTKGPNKLILFFLFLLFLSSHARGRLQPGDGPNYKYQFYVGENQYFAGF